MGSPEPPDQEENNCVRPQGVVLQVYGQNTSDDSDNENANNDRNNGYLPLPLGDGEINDISEDDDQDDMEFGQFNSDTTPNNQLDRIVPVDVEIESEVWNTPRPEALNIELDTTKSEQIMSAMASMTLPTAVIPDWARDVPEREWIDNLLQRIRDRQTPNYSDSVSINKDN